jgi:kynurenine formamidase
MRINKLLVFSAVLFVSACSSPWSADESSLWRIQQILAHKQYVDLTHEFAPGIPLWPGFPDEARKTNYWYEKRPDVMGTGFFSELYTHVDQWGTHVDPPAHFIKGLRTVDQIDPKEMILPFVVIDVHNESAKNPDYTLSLERVKKWEKRSRTDPDRRVCCDADRLVEALARRGKNRKQRCQWHRALPRMEFACPKVPL